MKTSLDHSSPGRGSGSMPSCEAAVEWLPVDCGNLPAIACIARFQGNRGVTECHVTVRLKSEATDPHATLTKAWKHALESAGIPIPSTVFRRVFCSDVANQSADPPAYLHATSIIGQPPLPAAKLALWSYHLCDPDGAADITADANHTICRRGGLSHHWITGLTAPGGGSSHEQTRRILENHDAWLQSQGMTLADHVARTWWFVQNIDADYQGLVDARRDFFATRGLTADTHYIASTGIAGTHPDLAAKVSLDSYAISGLRAEQLEFLGATDHLCPTHDYGVTFERATAVSYADRRHVWISGTASIDPAGRILHEGDVLGQLDRTMINIEALLAKAGANPGDLALILVYLRDPADGAVIDAALRERLGAAPFVLVHAAVCRPGWLIEIEGIAIVPAHRPDLPRF